MKNNIIAVFLVLSASANAGIFGPSSFEECILDQMKGIKSDSAADAVTYACRIKFPPKETSSYTPPETPQIHLFSSLGDMRPTLNALVAKIDIVSINTEQTGTNMYGVKSYDYGHHLKINLTNRHNFPINTIQVGIPKKGNNCSWDVSQYAEVYDCSGTAGALSSGLFTCQIPNLDRRRVSICTVGFGIVATKAEAAQFMQKYGIPKRRN
jgi:hypothetical protein